MVLCRAYHFHVAVLTSRGIWSTARKIKTKNCLFSLVYHGGFKFSETCKTGTGQEYMTWLHERCLRGKLPSHARNCMPDTLKVEEIFSTVPEALNSANNNVLCKHAADSTTPEIPIPTSHVCRLYGYLGVCLGLLDTK